MREIKIRRKNAPRVCYFIQTFNEQEGCFEWVSLSGHPKYVFEGSEGLYVGDKRTLEFWKTCFDWQIANSTGYKYDDSLGIYIIERGYYEKAKIVYID